MNEAIKLVGLIVGGILVFNTCSHSSTPKNFSGEGACASLKSLIDQIGQFEIKDSNQFYIQMESIVSQANNAATVDSKFGKMAYEVNSYLKVMQEKYPGNVPSFLGMIPMEVTSDEYCGTNYSEG